MGKQALHTNLIGQNVKLDSPAEHVTYMDAREWNKDKVALAREVHNAEVSEDDSGKPMLATFKERSDTGEVVTMHQDSDGDVVVTVAMSGMPNAGRVLKKVFLSDLAAVVGALLLCLLLATPAMALGKARPSTSKAKPSTAARARTSPAGHPSTATRRHGPATPAMRTASAPPPMELRGGPMSARPSAIILPDGKVLEIKPVTPAANTADHPVAPVADPIK